MRTPSIVAATALLAACSGGGEPAPLAGSSFLLVTIDTTRADAVGCYGGPDWTTPVIDRLAAEGVRFDQARSTCPVTLPAHSSILTGMMPFEHGVRDNSTFRLSDDVTTLAERLLDEGYATAAVMGAFVLHSDFGLAQGFEVYSDVPRRKLEMDVVEDQRKADEVVDEALALLADGQLEPPFFLWVHMFDPHRPLDPPDAFRMRALEGASPNTTPMHELERRVYHAEVAFADAELGRLLGGLAQAVPADELLVAVVSDHGEGFGDHGEPAHGLQLFDTTMRVPMVLHHPRLPAGRVVTQQVSTADLTPTALGLLGFDAQGATASDLTPLLFDETATRGAPVYFETCHPYYSYGWAPLFGLIDGSTKVVEGPAPAVYDVRADPLEFTNLLQANAAAHRGARDTFSALAPNTAVSVRIELQEDDRRALEQLGYAGGSADGGDAGPVVPGHVAPDLKDPAEAMPVKTLCQEAVTYLFDGDHERALTAIRQVLRLDPHNPIFLSQAGTIFITAGRPQEAIGPLARSVELREDPSARCSLAIAYNLTGDVDSAVDTLRLNARLHPRHLHTRFALGELLLERGDAAEALEHFESFLAEHDVQDPWHDAAEQLAARARNAARD
jgi:arylsulfatase A-like enzyme/Flp pilus assembly protein TadD